MTSTSAQSAMGSVARARRVRSVSAALALDDALVGHPGAGVDVDADARRADHGSDREGRLRVIAKYVNAERPIGARMTNSQGARGHCAHGNGRNAARKEWRIPEVFHDDPIESGGCQSPCILRRAARNRRAGLARTWASRERWQMHDADQAGRAPAQGATPRGAMGPNPGGAATPPPRKAKKSALVSGPRTFQA